MAKNNRYAFTIFSFLVLFLLSIFFISKRNLEPSLLLYRNFFSQAYSHIASPQQFTTLNSPAEADQVNSSAYSVQLTSPTDQTSATVSRPASTESNVSEGYVKSERLAVGYKKVPVAENESIVDNNGGLPFERDSEGLSVGDNKIPVAENESMVNKNESLSFERENTCDLYIGTWVKEEGYPIYKPGSCPYVDEAFDCQMNGRGDSSYLQWRWKPDGCDLPRYEC